MNDESGNACKKTRLSLMFLDLMNIKFYLTRPVAPIGDPYRENSLQDRKRKKGTISKIKKLILEDIDLLLAKSHGALFPSSAPPQVVADMLFSMGISFINERQKSKNISYIDKFSGFQRNGLRRNKSVKYVPIGLRAYESLPWMNSLMQFILFISGSDELFSFIPRSFSPFMKFAEQYFLDSEANRGVSSVGAETLIPCLEGRLPLRFFQKEEHFDFYKIFKAVTQLVFSSVKSLDPMMVQGAFLCCNQHIVLEEGRGASLEEMIYKKGSPEELLVTFYPATASCCRLISKQCFIRQKFLCYDLDAFIEFRSEGGHSAHFIAYLKIEGVWYQCDDERVSLLRSNFFNAALHQSVLFHYSRVGAIL